ncbi:MAG: Biotin carboxylase [Myxococcota bacterium]|nr:Biotin carboxylase [Myxococcota bacterium]
MPYFNKILIANRGEIAIRVIRACRELGIRSVAVFSSVDRNALFVRMADEAVHIGPAPSRESYLNTGKILDAAKKTGAEAIHPGYGFLSENPGFSDAVKAAGLVFIGPPAKSMIAMGEKTRARQIMHAAGVPVVPGTLEPCRDFDEARREAERIGFPLMLKAAAGGGGKGMRRVESMKELQGAWEGCVGEARSAFNDERVYIERYLEEPHHIEIQVLCDSHGAAIHLNERECSIQRRNQKLVEETPSTIITPELRAKMGEVAVRAAKAVDYLGAGTVEFLADKHRNFYFMEMNTRLQVEHPITEMTLGVDLVAEQIRIAAGHPMSIDPAKLERHGHAIEVRICAEDPENNFAPSPGLINYLRLPAGPGVRNDCGVYAGYTVPMTYDSMLAKLIVWAETRERAIDRMRCALEEYVVRGVITNITYLRAIISHPAFRAGDYTTAFIGEYMEGRNPLGEASAGDELHAVAAAAIAAHLREQAPPQTRGPQAVHNPWRTDALRRGLRER